MDEEDRAQSDETDRAASALGLSAVPPDGEVPPDDAEDWTDEQWLEWLSSTDPDAPVGYEKPSLPSRISKSAVGSVVGNAMLGLDFAIYGRHENEMVVIAEATGDHDDDEIDIQLDPEDPGKSTVQVHRDQQ